MPTAVFYQIDSNSDITLSVKKIKSDPSLEGYAIDYYD